MSVMRTTHPTTTGDADNIPQSVPTISSPEDPSPTFSVDQILSAVSHNPTLLHFVNPTLASPEHPEQDTTQTKSTLPDPRPRLRREVIAEQLLPLARRGLSAKAAAEHINQPYTIVLSIYNDESFRRDALAPMREAFGEIDRRYLDNRCALIQRIESGAERAFEKLMEIIDNPLAPMAVQASVARDILDRNASTRSGRNDTTRSLNVSVNISAEDLATAARAARAMDNLHTIPTQHPPSVSDTAA